MLQKNYYGIYETWLLNGFSINLGLVGVNLNWFDVWNCKKISSARFYKFYVGFSEYEMLISLCCWISHYMLDCSKYMKC